MPGGAEPQRFNMVQHLHWIFTGTGHVQSFIRIGDWTVLQISIYRSIHLVIHLVIHLKKYLMISLLNVSLREPNSSSNCSLRSEAMSFSRLWCSMAYLRTHDDTKITLVRLGYTRWKCYWCYCHLLSIASVVYVGVEACWKHHMPWDPWDIHKIYRAQSAVGHPIIPFQRKPLASCWSETIKDQNHHCKTSCPGQSLCILKHSLHLNWSIHEFQAGSYDCIRIDHIKIMSDHGMLYNWHRIRYHLHRQFLNIYIYI